jgi:hypothetical protein
MSKRNLFEVGATLLGIYFVVLGFRLIAVGFMASIGSIPSPINGMVYQALIWSSPAIFLVAGLLLIAKARRWGARLFEPEDKVPPSPTALTLEGLLRVGLMLLGAYFLVNELPDIVRLAGSFAEGPSTPLNYPNIAALALVVAVAAALLFKSRWVVGALMPGPAEGEGEAEGESEEPLLVSDDL